MATTAVKPAPTLEVMIKTAVKAWVKAEQSAIWNLIKAVYQGLQGVYGPDKETREKALKTWINQAFEEEYGAGASKDRAAHISKIFKIALNAKSLDFKRWEKAGTGFYKAYAEFAVPQANPAKKKPEVVSVPTGGGGGEGAPKAGDEKGAVTGETVINVDEEVQKLNAKKAAVAEAAKPSSVAPIMTETAKNEVAEYWATRIDSDKAIWTKLIDRLTTPKQTILTPDMVLEVLIGVAKKPTLLRNTVAVLMQNETVAKEVKEYLSDTAKK